jgi:hypothetical protein
LRRSEICEGVATLMRSFLWRRRLSSSMVERLRGSARAMSRVPFCEVVPEHEVDGDGPEKVVVDDALAEIDEFAAVAGCDGLGMGEFGRGGRVGIYREGGF